MVWIKPVIHGRHFGGYTDLVMICVYFMLILKVKKEVGAKDWPYPKYVFERIVLS